MSTKRDLSDLIAATCLVLFAIAALVLAVDAALKHKSLAAIAAAAISALLSFRAEHFLRRYDEKEGR